MDPIVEPRFDLFLTRTRGRIELLPVETQVVGRNEAQVYRAFYRLHYSKTQYETADLPINGFFFN